MWPHREEACEKEHMQGVLANYYGIALGGTGCCCDTIISDGPWVFVQIHGGCSVLLTACILAAVNSRLRTESLRVEGKTSEYTFSVFSMHMYIGAFRSVLSIY